MISAALRSSVPHFATLRNAWKDNTMTLDERYFVWLGLTADARANAAELRSMAKEWPAHAPRYLAEATKAYLRALIYLRGARRYRDMMEERDELVHAA